MVNTKLTFVLASVMLASGLGIASFSALAAPAEAHECPPEGCVEDGRMTGGGRLAGDPKVKHGFELYCDINDGPNNLQVNGDGGNRFHLTSLTEVRCLDDPAIEPKPPNAGFDRYEADGFGRFNGVDGYQIHFEFTDAGEPGKNDTAFIVIHGGDPSNPVLVANAFLDVGNHQAH